MGPDGEPLVEVDGLQHDRGGPSDHHGDEAATSYQERLAGCYRDGTENRHSQKSVAVRSSYCGGAMGEGRVFSPGGVM